MKITIEFCISELISFCTKFQLNPKKAGGWRGWMESIWHPSSPCWVFPEIYFSGREGEALPFCDFKYYHKSHLSRTFHRNSSSCSEKKVFFFNIDYFCQFFAFFISLLQRNYDVSIKQMVSAFFLPLTYVR